MQVDVACALTDLSDSSGAELCARILKSLAKAAWCLWRVSTVFTRSAITRSAGSEAIWMKIVAHS